MTLLELTTTLVLATSPVENSALDKQAIAAQIETNLTLELRKVTKTNPVKKLVKIEKQENLKEVSAE